MDDRPTGADRTLAAVLAGARAAHRRLLADLDGLDDATARRPSRLPGWTVGHVLTHLARNADSHARVLAGVARGEEPERYPGGRAQRDGEIDAGAGRPAAALVADVRTSAGRLEEHWATLAPEAWDGAGWSAGRREPARRLPWLRWREVEIHHHDLGLGFDLEQWSDEYVRRELAEAAMAWRARHAMGLTGLPAAALALPPRHRLAWLVGRLELDGLEPVPQWF